MYNVSSDLFLNRLERLSKSVKQFGSRSGPIKCQTFLLIKEFCKAYQQTTHVRHVQQVRKRAKIRNRYNQVPHPTQDSNGKVTIFSVFICRRQSPVVTVPFLTASLLGLLFSDMVRVVNCHARVLGSNPGGPKRFSPRNYFTGGSGNSVAPESASGIGSGLIHSCG